MNKQEFKAYLDGLVAQGQMTQEVANTCMEVQFPSPKKPTPAGQPFRTHSDIKRPWDETQTERFAREAGYFVK